MKIVVLGDSEVGKTALVLQVSAAAAQGLPSNSEQCFRNGFIEDYEPTFEDSYQKKLLLDSGKLVWLEVVDTGGHLNYATCRPQWIQNGHAFIIVFSANSRKSFTSVSPLAQTIKKLHPAGCPLALVATKRDLPGSVSVEEGEACAARLQAEYFHLSVKDGEEVEQPFKYLAHCLEGKQNLVSRTPAAKSSQTFATETGIWAWLWMGQHQRISKWTKSTFGSCIGAR